MRLKEGVFITSREEDRSVRAGLEECILEYVISLENAVSELILLDEWLSYENVVRNQVYNGAIMLIVWVPRRLVPGWTWGAPCMHYSPWDSDNLQENSTRISQSFRKS
jgi:hypothetical protein